eukprot:7617460-Ditylum_brightwellii.AAC.2
MSTMWKKISYTDSKKQHKLLTSLQILASWPSTEEQIDSIKSLENPKTARAYTLSLNKKSPTLWASTWHAIHSATIKCGGGLGSKLNHIKIDT